MDLFKRTAFLVGVVFVLSACSGSTQTQDTSVPTGLTPTTTSIWKIFQMSALKSAEDRWRRLDISDYQFTVSVSCFCFGGTGPMRVTVKEEKVTSVLPIDVQDSATVRPIPMYGWDDTAQDLFKKIQGHLGEYKFSATYDNKTGFPLSFYSAGESFVGDDEFGFTTGDLVLTQR